MGDKNWSARKLMDMGMHHADIAKLLNKQAAEIRRLTEERDEAIRRRDVSETLTIDARTQRNKYRAQVKVYRPLASPTIQAKAARAAVAAMPALPVVIYPARPESPDE